MASLGYNLNPKSARAPTRAEPYLLLAVVGEVGATPFCDAAASAKAYEVGGSDCIDAPPPFQVTVANSKAAQCRPPLDIYFGRFELVAQSVLTLVGSDCAKSLPGPSCRPTLRRPCG